jgi:excisionase family DNA binding protein
MNGTIDSTENWSQEAAEILDVKGAAKVLGCSVSHVSNILNGKVDGVEPIPHVRAGRLRLIRRQALMRWFEEQEHASLEVVRR